MNRQGTATADLRAGLSSEALAVVEAIPDRAVIIDQQGAIRALNAAWGFAGGADDWIGSDYFDRATELTGVLESELQGVISGVRGVLAGEYERFEVDLRFGPASVG